MAKTYTVKSGDTLSAIAKKHSTSVAAIMAANPVITNKNNIRVGWVLTIPGTGSESGGAAIVTPPKPSETDYEKLGKALEECYREVCNLPSFNKVMELMNNGNEN